MIIKIAFLGKMQSGKTTAVNKIWQLSEEYIMFRTIIKFAQPLYDCQSVFVQGEKHRLFLQDLSSLAKKCFGPQILSDIFKRRNDHHERLYANKPNFIALILCDDVRVDFDFETAKNLGFFVVGVSASDEIRKARNPKMFVGTSHETEMDIDRLIKKSDLVLDGNKNIDEFRMDVKHFWKKFTKDKIK